MLAALEANVSDFKTDLGIGGSKKAPPKKRKMVGHDNNDDRGFQSAGISQQMEMMLILKVRN